MGTGCLPTSPARRSHQLLHQPLLMDENDAAAWRDAFCCQTVEEKTDRPYNVISITPQNHSGRLWAHLPWHGVLAVRRNFRSNPETFRSTQVLVTARHVNANKAYFV